MEGNLNQKKDGEPQAMATGFETFISSPLSRRSILALGLAVLAIGLSLFSLYTAYFGEPQAHLHRSTYFSILLIVTLLTHPLKRQKWSDPLNWWSIVDGTLIGIVVTVQLYILSDSGGLIQRSASPTPTDVALGSLLIVVVLESSRRAAGWPMTLIAAFFLIQPVISHHLFWIFYGPPSSWSFIVGIQFLTTDGLFGIAAMAMASFIGLFILFGTLLQETGGGQFFLDLAMSVTGRQVGGPAKAAVVASALMGMVSGAATANVVTTGSFTIPLMKRLGYKPEFAGAVEAAASSGGQLMPPIMGVSAFLIAILLGVPYIEVVKAATIPALLYFLSIFLMVHFRSYRKGLRPVSSENIPKIGDVLKGRAHLLVPLVAIVVILVQGYTIMMAAFWGIASLFAVTMFKRDTRLSFIKFLAALEKGAHAMVPVGMACASAGIIIGGVFSSGVGINLSTTIIQVAHGHMILALIVTMLAALVLGMGLVTVAVYMTLAAILIPTLIQLGVEPMAAHLFAFYFGVISAITPPVCVAAFAAAGIAGSKPMATGIEACKIGICSYIVPYMFVFGPSLIGIGSAFAVAFSVVSAVVGVTCLAAGVQRWFIGAVTPIQSVILVAAALLLIKPGLVTDTVGFGLAAVVVLWQVLGIRGSGHRLVSDKI
jgi:TRAP transporter 4TM/12TM fusion protein